MMAVTVALASKFISEHYGAPTMLMALLIGMAFNFLAEPGNPCAPGVEFVAKKLLRFGVARLGLGITVQQILSAGPAVMVISISSVGLTILLVLIGSTELLPMVIKMHLLDFSRWCLVVAIAALGMNTSLGKLTSVGGSAIVLICALTMLLAGYSIAMIELLLMKRQRAS